MIHGDSELFEIDIVFSDGRRAGLNIRDDRVVCFFGAKAADQRPAPAIQWCNSWKNTELQPLVFLIIVYRVMLCGNTKKLLQQQHFA